MKEGPLSFLGKAVHSIYPQAQLHTKMCLYVKCLMLLKSLTGFSPFFSVGRGMSVQDASLHLVDVRTIMGTIKPTTML